MRSRKATARLLDHSLILFGSNMGNSNQHLHYDTPAMLVGGASGRLKGDRHLAYASRTVPTGNLLLSILRTCLTFRWSTSVTAPGRCNTFEFTISL